MSAYDHFVKDRLPAPERLPDFRFDLPELKYPDRLNAARELLAGGRPDDLAMVNAMGRWTYRDLDLFSGRIARFLVEGEGLVAGNRVLLRGPNSYTLLACWLGVLKAGGIAVATMPLLRPGEIATVIGRAEISHALVDSRFIGDFREAQKSTDLVRSLAKFDGDHGKGELEQATAGLDPLDPVDTGRDDPALIAFTSGTTGEPKGCVHFHRDILAPCESFARHLMPMQPGDIALTSAPLAFTFGLGAGFLFPLRSGAACATVELATPEAMLKAIAEFGISHLSTAPTAYKAMLAPDLSDPLDAALKSLTYCLSAGEHLPSSVWKMWKDRTGIAITDGIGSTEMMHIFISAAGEDIKPGATGKAVPGYVATLLDDEGRPMAAGIGRLAVQGPTGCRYLDDPRQTDYVKNGWNVTGDTYRRDTDGYYWYLARSDDMIVSSGYNIGAPEVENALLLDPLVKECAVVGVRCSDRGQKVKAFIVLTDPSRASDATARALQDHCKSLIAPYKYPREIEFVESLPKTATGKLRRVELRERR